MGEQDNFFKKCIELMDEYESNMKIFFNYIILLIFFIVIKIGIVES